MLHSDSSQYYAQYLSAVDELSLVEKLFVSWDKDDDEVIYRLMNILDLLEKRVSDAQELMGEDHDF